MSDAKRFLLQKSGYDVNILWLDDHGSCTHFDHEGNLYPTDFHPYRDAKGLVYARRCPNSLTQNEWTRCFVDDPPGSWVRFYTDYKSAPPKRQYSEDSA